MDTSVEAVKALEQGYYVSSYTVDERGFRIQ